MKVDELPFENEVPLAIFVYLSEYLADFFYPWKNFRRSSAKDFSPFYVFMRSLAWFVTA